MEAKQATLTSFYNTRKKTNDTKLITDSQKTDISTTINKGNEVVLKNKSLKITRSSRSRKVNIKSTRASIIELLEAKCSDHVIQLDTSNSDCAVDSKITVLSDKTDALPSNDSATASVHVSSPGKRKHVDSLCLQNVCTPEQTGNTTKIDIKEKPSSSARKLLPLFDKDGDDIDPGSRTEAVDNLKLTAEKLKANLVKCGKLEELQKQLLMIKELKTSTRIPTEVAKTAAVVNQEVTVSSKAVSKIPVHERFQHLILPLPLTLTLPYSYNVLENTFRASDDVVRILHNRLEVCTFAKLKAAVEEITKRNFSKLVLGQIKTIYPAAYDFKQEKGLPKAGYKSQDFQLTVTPLLDDYGISVTDSDSGKVKFTASALLVRKKIFHTNLVKRVLKIHKEFLMQLPKPMSIADEKLTRWHPKFRLDQVPDVEACLLPQPPNVKVYQTAKDVLADTKKKLHPKVERALINVASVSSTSPSNKSTLESDQQKPSAKGIPGGLLERIRAKEAKRLEESLTRSPLGDQRDIMLNRLPHIYRILRTYFVTEKKPALLFDTIVETICESYRSSISKADVEKHLKLLLELAPNWMSLAITKNGKYLKLDRTVKLQSIQDKINSSQKILQL